MTQQVYNYCYKVRNGSFSTKPRVCILTINSNMEKFIEYKEKRSIDDVISIPVTSRNYLGKYN